MQRPLMPQPESILGLPAHLQLEHGPSPLGDQLFEKQQRVFLLPGQRIPLIPFRLAGRLQAVWRFSRTQSASYHTCPEWLTRLDLTC